MPKKAKEVEENIEVTTPVKQETFATLWFKDNAVENPDVIKTICDLTARSAKEQFHLNLPRGNSEIYAMIFYATFMTVLDFIRSKEKTYNNFTMEIAKSINIGFTNNTDEDNEKVGNFMPIMEYIGVNRSIVNEDYNKGDPIDKSFMDWKELNTKKTVDYYKELQDKTFNVLMNDYKTNIRTPECVIPLFCIFLDMIVSVLKMKYREAEGTDVSEVQINVLGLFDAYYSYVERALDVLEWWTVGEGASYWSQYNDTMPALESLQDDEELMDVQTLKDASAFVDSYQIRPQLPGYMNYQIYTINSNVSAYLSGGRSIEDTIRGLKDTSYLLG